MKNISNLSLKISQACRINNYSNRWLRIIVKFLCKFLNIKNSGGKLINTSGRVGNGEKDSRTKNHARVIAYSSAIIK